MALFVSDRSSSNISLSISSLFYTDKFISHTSNDTRISLTKKSYDSKAISI